MKLWRSVVGKLWATIILLVAVVLFVLGLFLLKYIDMAFYNANDVKHLFIFTCIIGFALTTFFAFFLSTKITQPLVEMKEAAKRITQGDYNSRIKARSNDEIGDLAAAFNHMAGQLEKTVQDLSHEKEHLGSVLRSMTDAVITFDSQGEVILANPEGSRLLHEWSRLAWMDDEEASEAGKGAIPSPLQSIFESVTSGGKELTSKVQVHQGVWSVVMTPLHSHKLVRGAVAVLRNITEEHKLDKLRIDFVANVSHELRTPLSMLQGYSEALLDDIAGSAEERRELAQIILDESLRMGRLVHNLLDLARMEVGYNEMNCDEVSLRRLTQRVVRKFSAIAKENEIELIMNIPDDELLLSCADEDRLEQVLTNLLDNALRHTPEGKRIIVAGEKVIWREHEAIKMMVSDEGEGIPAEDVTYIFERFYKADKARTRASSHGTGLGLAIVKNIIEAHQGAIQAESTLGEGTTFTFYIPTHGNGMHQADQ